MNRWSTFLLVAISTACLGGFSSKNGTVASPKPLIKKHQIPLTFQRDLIKVMVIDTGIDPHEKLKDFVAYDGSDNYKDHHGHGTHIAGIIAYGNDKLNDPLCDFVRIYSCKYYDPQVPGNRNLVSTTICIQRAISEKMDYVNYSGGGLELSFAEFELYRKFTKSGGTVVTAAGNEKSSLIEKPYYPASYAYGFEFKRFDPKTHYFKTVKVKPLKNFIVVENECKDGKLCKSSNSHPLALRAVGENIYSTLPSNSYGYMTGTSQAAPEVLHFILRERCKDIQNGFQEVDE